MLGPLPWETSCLEVENPRAPKGTKCLLVAEGVEKVRTIKFCATIVRVSRARGNIDSKMSRILNHCFKNFDLRDFFNTLWLNAEVPKCADLRPALAL